LPFWRPSAILVFLPMLRVEINLIAPRWLKFFPAGAYTFHKDWLGRRLEAHPERAFWEIRASKTKGLWFKKRPKTLFPDASLEYPCFRFAWEIRN
jgi:hypothetical protein